MNCVRNSGKRNDMAERRLATAVPFAHEPLWTRCGGCVQLRVPDGSRLRCLEMRIITGFGEGVGGGLPAESAEAEATRRVAEFFLRFFDPRAVDVGICRYVECRGGMRNSEHGISETHGCASPPPNRYSPGKPWKIAPACRPCDSFWPPCPTPNCWTPCGNGAAKDAMITRSPGCRAR